VKIFLSLIFVIWGLLLFGLGIYTSFEIYAINKQEKINANFASFMLSVYEGKELKNIDYPDQGFFIFKPAEGKIYTYGQVFQNPTDVNMYLSYHKISPSNSEVYIYTRKYNFGEYTEEMLKNPTSLGIAFAGLILSAIGVYKLILQAQRKSTEVKIVEKNYPQDLEGKLKALRLAIATYEVIPKESIEEVKRILDDILKDMEGRK